jgi:hypothetical protein
MLVQVPAGVVGTQRRRSGLYVEGTRMLARDFVLAFLDGRRRPVCVACIAHQAHLAFALAHDACLDLSLRPEYTFGSGRCADCGADTDVVQPARPARTGA